MIRRRSQLLLFSFGLAMLSSCGYHVGGKAETIPQAIHVIAVPAFASASTRYRLVDILPQQVSREFNTRTRFTAVTDPDQADAVLHGTVNLASVGAAVYDQTSGKATTASVIVVVSITLSERSTGRVLFSRPGLIFRQNYGIAVDPHQFFDESSPAFDRLSQELGRDIVSAIIENF